jgi:biopolymer transport protein ExbB
MWVGLTQYEMSKDRDVLRETVEEAGQREAFLLERGVGALGVVASLEPLLGLLGTVVGMIQAFQQVELSGGGDPRVLAGGVWAALLTTAAGLCVAIPAYIAYRFLLARVDRFTLDLQNDVTLLLEALQSSAPVVSTDTSVNVPASVPVTQTPAAAVTDAKQDAPPVGEEGT